MAKKKKVNAKVWTKCRRAATIHGHRGGDADEVASSIYDTLSSIDFLILNNDIEKTPLIKKD